MKTALKVPTEASRQIAETEYLELHAIEGGVGFEVVVGEEVVEVRVTRLRWDGADLHGEVLLLVEGDEALTTPWVLTRPASRRDVLALLDRNSRLPWQDILNVAAREVIKAQRRGDHPIVELRSVPLPPPDRLYELAPLPPVLRTMVNIWFGGGGVGKSYLSLYAAGVLAGQGVRTLYLDWEMDSGEHRFRLERLFGKTMPNVHYLQCGSPLPQMAETLRELIRAYRIQFVIVDSIAFALGGDAASSSVANEYLQAVRSLGVGSLHLAHTTKPSGGGRKRKKSPEDERGSSAGGEQFPFGSVFWHNGARSTWNFVGVDAEWDVTTIAAHHRKTNTARRLPSRTLTLTFDGDHGPVTVMESGDCDHADNRTKGTVADRIRALLPMTREALRAQLPDLKSGTFNRTISREIEAARFLEVEGVITTSDAPEGATHL